MSNPRRDTRTKTNSKMSAIQRQIRDLRRETATSVTIRPAAADPPAITNNGRWIARKVYVQGGGQSNPTLDLAAVCQALKSSNNIGATGDFYILKISVWGNYGNALDNVCSGNIKIANLTVSGSATAADQIFARDLGSGTRRPGFTVHIPRTDSLLQNFDTAAGTPLMDSVTNSAEYHITVLQLI